MTDKKAQGFKSTASTDSLPPALSGSKMPQVKPAKPPTSTPTPTISQKK